MSSSQQQRQQKPLVNYQEIQGDLFDSSADAIAHCVSEDLAMGKGIATEFKRRYQRVQELQQQGPRKGTTLYLERSEEEGPPRVVFYMITKPKYWHIPSYNDLWESLLDMRRKCHSLEVQSLGMPLIACGLDCLEWEMVRKMIVAAFWDAEMDVTVYRYHLEK